MKSTSLLTVTTLFQVHILLITNQDGSFIHKTFRGISVKVLDPVGAKTVAFVEVQRVIIHNFGRVQRTNVFLFVPMEHLIGYLHVKVLIDHRVRTIITSYHNSQENFRLVNIKKKQDLNFHLRRIFFLDLKHTTEHQTENVRRHNNSVD